MDTNHATTPDTEQRQRTERQGRPRCFLPILAALLLAPATMEAQPLKTEFLGTQQGFSHIARTTANGVTTIRISGQIGWADGAAEPAADLAGQAETAFANVVKRLEQAGATASDLVKTTVYIKDIDPEKVQTVARAQAGVLQLDPPRAATWVGVTGLVYPSLLIEVEAVAVIAADE